VWEHLAKDVARATEQLARGAADKAASDPLGAALADEKEDERRLTAKARTKFRDKNSLRQQLPHSHGSTGSGMKRPRSSDERVSEQGGAELPASVLAKTTSAPAAAFSCNIVAAASVSGPDPALFKRSAKPLYH